MRTFEEMKQIIESMGNNDYAIPAGVALDGLIADMLRFVGTVDSGLREGIYAAFDTLNDNEAFSHDQLRHILNTAIDEQHLFLGIGESDTDDVFTRAFSSLLVCVALCTYEDDPYLTDEELTSVKETILRYMSQEKDYRGYVKDKGWAHAIAHGADMLLNIVYCVGREGIFEALDAIVDAVSNKYIVYGASEDERLADAVISAIYTSVCDRQIITADEICSWLEKVGSMVERTTMPDDYNINLNRKNFMKSLYVKVLLDVDDDFEDNNEVKDQICTGILDILQKMYA
ncbi:MAG: DUF2785 domain-containing protein [Defluviitaleaceae bacterium]|nr:DUF2785 domain-containing protein [Defluviitaleaceae bacterium]